MDIFSAYLFPSQSFCLAQELAREKPYTYLALKRVQGMGEQKLRNYGQQIQDVSNTGCELELDRGSYLCCGVQSDSKKVLLQNTYFISLHGMFA